MSYSPFRHIGSAFLKRRPIQLTFFVTRKCNAGCRFCFYRSENSARRRGATCESPQELGLGEIKKICASLGPLLWLAFSGGEIFLREDLPDIAAAFYSRNRPSIILLPTNGLLPGRISEMTERILKTCPKSTVVVKLSLDGPQDVHDRLRGVQGAYRKALETERLLSPLLARYRNFELGINSVLCSENQQEMEKLIRFVKDIGGIRTHTVSLIRGDVDEKLKSVEHGAYEEVCRLLASNAGNSGLRYRFAGGRLKAAQDVLQRRLIGKTARAQTRLVPCYAGKLTLVLTETGRVYPCESFSLPLGNVRKYHCSMQKLLESGEAAAALAALRKSYCCCTHECYMMMNILFNPALYPALIKEYLSLVLRG